MPGLYGVWVLKLSGPGVGEVLVLAPNQPLEERNSTMGKNLGSTPTSWKAWMEKNSIRKPNHVSIVEMAEAAPHKNVRFCKGDVVFFRLNAHAEFNADNRFTGEILEVIPKRLAVIVRGDEEAVKKLGGWFLNAAGLALISFRNCRVKSLEAHNDLVARIRREKAARDRMERGLKILARRHGGPKNVARKKDKKDNNWVYVPGAKKGAK